MLNRDSQQLAIESRGTRPGRNSTEQTSCSKHNLEENTKILKDPKSSQAQPVPEKERLKNSGKMYGEWLSSTIVRQHGYKTLTTRTRTFLSNHQWKYQ
jgi:hypothetical protein